MYTRGSETSQYPEEKKINKIISLVAASEKEEAQTGAQHRKLQIQNFKLQINNKLKIKNLKHGFPVLDFENFVL
jgi:hypothetical protein